MEKKIANSAKNNSKALCGLMFSRKTKCKPTIPELIMSSNKITSTDLEKADVLGEYSSSVFVKEPDWSGISTNDREPITEKRLDVSIKKELLSKNLKV